MAYPGENEHTEYLKYVEEISLGDRPGPQMTKDEWRKSRIEEQSKTQERKKDRDPTAPSIYNREYQ